MVAIIFSPTVCQDNQFNYSRARELGYLGQTYFLVGEVNGSEATSWLGNSTNQTYEDIQKDLFNGNITDLVVVNADNEAIFIQPYGFCNQVLNFSIEENQQIHSHLTVRVLILDPYRYGCNKIQNFAGNSLNQSAFILIVSKN